jgi:predicted O-methyltransferase YrrM
MNENFIDKAIADGFAIHGWMSKEHLRWLAEHAVQCDVVIEVGVWKGRSTKVLALARKVVYAVDHWMGPKDDVPALYEVKTRGPDALYGDFIKNLSPEIESRKVAVIRAESGEAAKIVAQTLSVARTMADMVFIDGDHSYEAVKRDIAIWSSLVRQSGIIAGHDYDLENPAGVVKAVKEMLPQHNNYGIIWYAQKP